MNSVKFNNKLKMYKNTLNNLEKDINAYVENHVIKIEEDDLTDEENEWVILDYFNTLMDVIEDKKYEIQLLELNLFDDIDDVSEAKSLLSKYTKNKVA